MGRRAILIAWLVLGAVAFAGCGGSSPPSPVPVDDGVPGVDRTRDPWEITMGDEQYAWLTRTLETSRARYKFVFAHHVNGTGRGGAKIAHSYEWGATTVLAPRTSSPPGGPAGPGRSTS